MDATKILEAALQAAWNDFCADAEAFPDCFWITRGPKLWADFRKGNFAMMVAHHVAILAPDTNALIETHAREIEAKDAEIERLREALKPFAQEMINWDAKNNEGEEYPDDKMIGDNNLIDVGDLRRAEAALLPQPGAQEPGA